MSSFGLDIDPDAFLATLLNKPHIPITTSKKKKKETKPFVSPVITQKKKPSSLATHTIPISIETLLTRCILVWPDKFEICFVSSLDQETSIFPLQIDWDGHLVSASYRWKQEDAKNIENFIRTLMTPLSTPVKKDQFKQDIHILYTTQNTGETIHSYSSRSAEKQTGMKYMFHVQVDSSGIPLQEEDKKSFGSLQHIFSPWIDQCIQKVLGSSYLAMVGSVQRAKGKENVEETRFLDALGPLQNTVQPPKVPSYVFKEFESKLTPL